MEIDKAVLYGSVVKGNSTAESDIELAIFSKSFTENILKNLDFIAAINIRYPEIDVHTYPAWYLKKNEMWVQDIIKNGIEV